MFQALKIDPCMCRDGICYLQFAEIRSAFSKQAFQLLKSLRDEALLTVDRAEIDN
jgi:hypothetical protein